jgi:cell division septum initiation protein DivIVA
MDTPQPASVTQEDIHAWLTEIRDLKNTVAALRNALEQELDDKKKSVQEALTASSTEIAQLKSTAGRFARGVGAGAHRPRQSSAGRHRDGEP